jgi:hypothetical protein
LHTRLPWNSRCPPEMGVVAVECQWRGKTPKTPIHIAQTASAATRNGSDAAESGCFGHNWCFLHRYAERVACVRVSQYERREWIVSGSLSLTLVLPSDKAPSRKLTQTHYIMPADMSRKVILAPTPSRTFGQIRKQTGFVGIKAQRSSALLQIALQQPHVFFRRVVLDSTRENYRWRQESGGMRNGSYKNVVCDSQMQDFTMSIALG